MEALLSNAARCGDAALVKVLCENFPELDRDCVDARGLTPLMHAARRGHAGVASLLVHYGANINATSSARVTPLQSAVIGGDLRTIAALLRAGARLDAVARGGLTELLGYTSSSASWIEEREEILSLLEARVDACDMAVPNAWQSNKATEVEKCPAFFAVLPKEMKYTSKDGLLQWCNSAPLHRVVLAKEPKASAGSLRVAPEDRLGLFFLCPHSTGSFDMIVADRRELLGKYAELNVPQNQFEENGEIDSCEDVVQSKVQEVSGGYKAYVPTGDNDGKFVEKSFSSVDGLMGYMVAQRYQPVLNSWF